MRSFHLTRRGPILTISRWLVTASAHLRPEAHNSASSEPQRPGVQFVGVLPVCPAVRPSLALRWVMFHAALCFRSKIQQYHENDTKYHVPYPSAAAPCNAAPDRALPCSAAPCSCPPLALPYCAVLYTSVRFVGMICALRAFLCTFSTCQVSFEVSYHRSY